MKISATANPCGTLFLREDFPVGAASCPEPLRRVAPPSCLCSGRLPRRAPLAHAQWLCRVGCIRLRLRLAEFGIENYFRKSNNVGNHSTRAVEFKIALIATC